MTWHKGGRHPAFTILELVVVLAILGVVIGLLVPAVQRVREMASAVGCKNNLKQIGLALHNYHDVYQAFPLSKELVNETYVSWPRQILEYGIGQKDAKSENPIPLLSCPSDPNYLAERVYQGNVWPGFGKQGCTNYVATSSSQDTYDDLQNGVINRISKVKIPDIYDGTSCTVMVGERVPYKDLAWAWWDSSFDGDFTWGAMSKTSLQFRDGIQIQACPAGPSNLYRPGSPDDPCSINHFGSMHSGGAHWLRADGSVGFLDYRFAAYIPKLVTRQGQEVVDLPAW